MKAALTFEHEPIGRHEADTRSEPMRTGGEPLQQLPLARDVSCTGLESGSESERCRHPHASTHTESLRPLTRCNDVLRLTLELDDGTRRFSRSSLKRFDLEPRQ